MLVVADAAIAHEILNNAEGTFSDRHVSRRKRTALAKSNTAVSSLPGCCGRREGEGEWEVASKIACPFLAFAGHTIRAAREVE